METALVPTTAAPLAQAHELSRTLVDAFLAGRSPRTLAAYRGDLEAFRAHLALPTAEHAAHALLSGSHGQANGMALAYRAAMLEDGLAAATVNRRLAAVRSLVKLARTLGMVPWTLEVEGVDAQPYRDTRGCGVQGVRAILVAASSRQDAKGARDVAVIRCLFDLALRRGELVALDLDHLDFTAGTVSVLGKGRRARETMTVPAPTLAALRAWVDVRGTEPGPLFFTMHRGMHGQRLTGDGVAVILRTAGEAAGIGKVRPHGLRHAGITRGLDVMAGDVRKVQRFSRHRDVRTLNTYDDNREDIAGKIAALVAASV